MGMSEVRRGSASGFTLIELMIVLVIVGVLAMIAVPAYNGFVKKANRAAAMGYLMQAAHRQQLFFNDTRTYSDDEAVLNLTQPERVRDFYTVLIELDPNSPPPGFSITATPKARQEGDGVLFIDSRGTKTREGEPW